MGQNVHAAPLDPMLAAQLVPTLAGNRAPAPFDGATMTSLASISECDDLPQVGPDPTSRSTIALMPGTFFHGDNLDVLRERIPDACVDLVYLDPPFNSDQDFSLPFGADAARPEHKKRAFRDTWWWDDAAADAYRELTETRVQLMPEKIPGIMRALHDCLYPKYKDVMLAYLANMAVRLVELKRVMKSTASLYLHCDPTASHYLKLVLDAIFGPDRFANEIIWQRTNARTATDRWPRVHDVLLFYSKDEKPPFIPLKVPGDVAKQPHTLITGADGKKYQTFELTAPHLRFGETGKEWHGFQPAKMGRCWANPPSVMDEWDREGLIHWPKKEGGWPRRRAAEPFDPSQRMVTVGDVWTDIDRLNQTSKERVHYPTQKPLSLLKRILEASSKPGDLILDPFCGCGTTVIACEQLGRRWIGIDIGDEAIAILRSTRIPKECPGAIFNEEIEPFDIESARKLAPLDQGYKFQWWAVRKLGGRSLEGKQKKGGDRGIDGEILTEDADEYRRQRRVIISVKSGGNPQPAWVDQLFAVVKNQTNNASTGILVLLEPPTRGMKDRAREHGIIQIVTAENLVDHKFRLELPGRNVTPHEVPKLKIPEEKVQGELLVDTKPKRRGGPFTSGMPPKGEVKRPSAPSPPVRSAEPTQPVQATKSGHRK